MRGGLTAIGWTLVLVAGAGCATVSPHSIAKGRRLAEANCSRCHAIAGAAQSPMPGAPRFSELMNLSQGRSLEEIFAEATLTQHAPMPNFLGDDKAMADLLDYLRSVQAPPPQPR